MNTRYNFSKILTAFIAAAVTAIFSYKSTKTLAVETKDISSQTLQERLSKVREKLELIEQQQNDSELNNASLQNCLKAKKDEIFLTQWYNWNNWRNSWHNY
ncbi:MAG: hypothetical protein JO235_10660 [Chroococcidiopsidaceae cyanobacterium CP_BM_RX_35]|nr:hypothetical protein [Chroococcidiopsidaceae cyanobacterium CP_BM_RX_35]